MIRSVPHLTLFVGLAMALTGCESVEKSLLFQPSRVIDAQPIPTDVRAEDVMLQLLHGTQIHARWFPEPMSRGAVLFCHGNAGNLLDRTNTILQLRESLGESVLIFDYPGYGRSGGDPNEAGLYAAADAAYDWLTQKKEISPSRVILFGESLGGGVAVDLALRRPCQALVLVKTFTSVPDLARDKIPWLPSRGLITSQFDNLGKINVCNRPIFIAHGTADRVIPFSEGQRLFAAAREPKQFLTLADADHNDPLGPDFYGALREFLARMDARPANLGTPSFH